MSEPIAASPAPSLDVVRAWKDPVYRAGLGTAALAELPDPIASPQLGDGELAEAYGVHTYPVTTAPTCTMTTWKKGCCP